MYLYYKNRNLLILAYGVSERHVPNRVWHISDAKTIKQYFADNNLGEPERYGRSFVFKSYDLNQNIDKNDVNKDLNNLISLYRTSFEEPNIPTEQIDVFSKLSFLKSLT